MARKPASKPADSTAQGDFESLVISIVEIHQKAQDFSTKAVNVGLTLRNWLIGWILLTQCNESIFDKRISLSFFIHP
jgi:hypothetical protein